MTTFFDEEIQRVDQEIQRVDHTKRQGWDQVVQLVSDEQLEEAFEGTNFGGGDKRQLIAHGILAVGAGYHTGHTLRQIMIHLKLITERGRTTRKGRMYAMWWFLVVL